jgi:ribosome-associated protein
LIISQAKVMLHISNKVSIPDHEIEFTAILAQGSGGQNVNKVSSAMHLRFDINASSLPDYYKEKLLQIKDSRITKEGIVIIKAQKFRTQESNRNDALSRLQNIIKKAVIVQRKRKKTKPTRGSIEKRLEHKKKQAKLKGARGKIEY